MNFYDDKVASTTINKQEKRKRLMLRRQINSRNYRIEKKATLLLQKGYIDFILASSKSPTLKQ